MQLLHSTSSSLSKTPPLGACSGTGLRENLGLMGATLGIHAGLMLLSAPLLVSTLSALTNGHVAYNSARAGGSDVQPGHCVDGEGHEVSVHPFISGGQRGCTSTVWTFGCVCVCPSGSVFYVCADSDDCTVTTC